MEKPTSQKLRNSGIETLGELPWGSHVCHFYETREDLLETLVPWFTEGLRSNELCVWVVSEPLSKDCALEALKNAIPELPAYIKQQRLRILRYDEWYLENGSFSSIRVLDNWNTLLEAASLDGLDGLRVTGNTSWVHEGLRESFMEYERSVHCLMRGRRMLALCTYPHSSLGSIDIAETVSSHATALMKKDGRWHAVTRAGNLSEQNELLEKERRCALISDLTSDLVFRLEIGSSGDLSLEWMTDGFRDFSGYGPGEIDSLGKLQSIMHPESRADFRSALHKVLAGAKAEVEIKYLASSGALRWIGLQMLPEHHSGTRIIKGVVGTGEDITLRKEAEERVLESEQKYRCLYDSIGDGLLRVGPDGRITDSNPALWAMLGYSRQELLNCAYSGITAAEWLASEEDILRTELQTTGAAEYEKEFTAKDGRRVPAHVRAWPLRDSDGRQAGFWAFVKDLTESRTAERKILNSENLLNGLILSLPGTFYVIDSSGRIVKWNRALEDISGYSREEIARMHPEEFFAPQDRALIRQKMEDTFLYSAAEVEAALVTKEGGRIPFHFRAVLSRIDNEPFIIGTGTDISNWKKAEQVLRSAKAELEAKVSLRTRELMEMNRLLKRSEERFRVLVETTSDWVWEVDANAVYTYVSPKVTEILGYEPHEVLGKTPFDLMPPEEASNVGAVFGRIAAIKRPFALLENKNIHKDGKIIYLETSGAPILDPGGNLLGYRGVDRDITKRKLQEADKSRMQHHLVQSQKMEAIGILAGGIAHDFNNLMVIIRLNNSLAMKKSEDSQEMKLYLEQIESASERAENLTRQLLIFSRRQPTDLRTLDLNRKVSNTLGMLRRLIGENIRIQTSLSSDIGRIRADKSNVEQIVMNLVINARDAMPGGGSIHIKTERVDVGSSSKVQSGSHVKLMIEDTGAGMDAGVIQHIFEPFFSTKGPRGTGLGLAVVNNIVRELGGWIDVESRLGEGTRFEIYFPAAEVPVEEPREDERVQEQPGKGERVLIVEDEKLLRKSVSVVLSKNGYRVLEAASAGEAKRLFETERGDINLVFSDMVLQDRDGIQLINELKQLYSGFKVLITSGYLDVESQWPAIKEKGYSFLQKPYEIPDLLRSVRIALEKRP